MEIHRAFFMPNLKAGLRCGFSVSLNSFIPIQTKNFLKLAVIVSEYGLYL